MLVTSIALATLLTTVASVGPTPPLPTADGRAEFVVTAPRYRITRTSRSASQIVARANQVISVLGGGVQPDQAKLTAWASAAVADPTDMVWVRPVVGDNFIAVGYRRRDDEVLLLNTYYLDLMPDTFPLAPSEDVGVAAARLVMEDAVADLIAAGIVRTGMPYGSAQASYMREKHTSGTQTREWVTEYIFTMNFVQNGITFPDIGLKIGVHRKGVVSSIHATDATLTNMGSVATTLTVAQAKARLTTNLASTFPAGVYKDIDARQGALMRPALNVETVDPGGIFNYTLAFPGGHSRQRISRVSLVTGVVEHLYL